MEEIVPNSEIKRTSSCNRDIKLIIVGDSGTGKTSLVNKFILNKFSQTCQATIASQFSNKIIKIDDVLYRLQFWDLAGQDRSPETTGIFCQGANGIIFCCEVKNKKTRDNIIKWKESIENNVDTNKISSILMENKCDLLGKNENDYNIDIDSLKNFCDENKINGCFRTSALNGYGVDKAMDFLLREIIKDFDADVVYDGRDTVALSQSSRKLRNGNNSCC